MHNKQRKVIINLIMRHLKSHYIIRDDYLHSEHLYSNRKMQYHQLLLSKYTIYNKIKESYFNKVRYK